MWKAYQGDIISAGWLLAIATCLLISALLIRLAVKKWGHEKGTHFVYLAVSVLPLLPALYIAVWQPINLWGGLFVIVVAMAIMFGDPPKRRRSRRYRY